MSFFENLPDIDEEEEEEEEMRPTTTHSKMVIQPVNIHLAINKEIRSLRSDSKVDEATDLDNNKNTILCLFKDSQEKLHGCRDIEPVKNYLRERLRATLPFKYTEGDRPLKDSDWDFIIRRNDSLIRILYDTFYPCRFDESRIKEWGIIFTELKIQLSQEAYQKCRDNSVARIHHGFGHTTEEGAAFIEQNPDMILEEQRLRRRVFEGWRSTDGDDNYATFVEDMLVDLPTGSLCVMKNADAEDDVEGVEVNPSRENSPERGQMEEDESDEDIGECFDFRELSRAMASLESKIKQKHKSILKMEKGWHRSDMVHTRPINDFEIMTYAEYSAAKKKVKFIDTYPTECFIYYDHRPWRTNNFYISGYAHGMKISYEDYKKHERRYIMHRKNGKHYEPKGPPTTSRKLEARGYDKYNARKITTWRNRHVTTFLRSEPYRNNIATGGYGYTHSIPAHAYLRNEDLGQLVITEFIMKDYVNRMISFEDERPFPQRHAGLLPRQSNFCHGVLILSDGILEDVDYRVLLNCSLFSFPPPFAPEDAVNLLIDCWEACEFVHDVIVSWGFDELIETQNVLEAFVSHLMFATEVRNVFEENRRRINLERTQWDYISPVKVWMFTIPEEGTYAPQLRKYNDLIRKLCIEDSGFHLIDWAEAVSVAPQAGGDLLEECTVEGTERRLQLFFRICREKLDLLHRRRAEERATEIENQNIASNFGTGPWLRDIYTILDTEPLKYFKDDMTMRSKATIPSKLSSYKGSTSINNMDNIRRATASTSTVDDYNGHDFNQRGSDASFFGGNSDVKPETADRMEF